MKNTKDEALYKNLDVKQKGNVINASYQADCQFYLRVFGLLAFKVLRLADRSSYHQDRQTDFTSHCEPRAENTLVSYCVRRH